MLLLNNSSIGLLKERKGLCLSLQGAKWESKGLLD
jgi:hypothetical protein